MNNDELEQFRKAIIQRKELTIEWMDDVLFNEPVGVNINSFTWFGHTVNILEDGVEVAGVAYEDMDIALDTIIEKLITLKDELEYVLNEHIAYK